MALRYSEPDTQLGIIVGTGELADGPGNWEKLLGQTKACWTWLVFDLTLRNFWLQDAATPHTCRH